MDRSINQLVTDGSSRSRQITDELASTSPSTSNQSICSPQSIDDGLPTNSASKNNIPVRLASQHVTPSPATEASVPAGQNEGQGLVLEGGSSLTAHSTLAIDFLDKVVGADRRKGYNFETRELLDSLRQIVHATKAQPLHAESLFSFAQPSAPQRLKPSTMPPIQVAAAMIRKAEGAFSHVRYPSPSTLLAYINIALISHTSNNDSADYLSQIDVSSHGCFSTYY